MVKRTIIRAANEIKCTEDRATCLSKALLMVDKISLFIIIIIIF